MPPNFRIGITQDGGIFRDGERVSANDLYKFFDFARDLEPEPIIFLEIEAGAPCTTIERVRREMTERLDCRNHRGACREGVFSVWEGIPDPPGAPVS